MSGCKFKASSVPLLCLKKNSIYGLSFSTTQWFYLMLPWNSVLIVVKMDLFVAQDVVIGIVENLVRKTIGLNTSWTADLLHI